MVCLKTIIRLWLGTVLASQPSPFSRSYVATLSTTSSQPQKSRVIATHVIGQLTSAIAQGSSHNLTEVRKSGSHFGHLFLFLHISVCASCPWRGSGGTLSWPP